MCVSLATGLGVWKGVGEGGRRVGMKGWSRWGGGVTWLWQCKVLSLAPRKISCQMAFSAICVTDNLEGQGEGFYPRCEKWECRHVCDNSLPHLTTYLFLLITYKFMIWLSLERETFVMEFSLFSFLFFYKRVFLALLTTLATAGSGVGDKGESSVVAGVGSWLRLRYGMCHAPPLVNIIDLIWIFPLVAFPDFRLVVFTTPLRYPPLPCSPTPPAIYAILAIFVVHVLQFWLRILEYSKVFMGTTNCGVSPAPTA